MPKPDIRFHVWVGAFQYSIQFVADLKKRYGEADKDKLLIRITKKCAEPIQRSTALHEIIHAYIHAHNHDLKEVTKEEKFVRIAEGLFHILADPRNTEFTQWVIHGTSEG